ncbi:MAG: hypothetical protein CL433_01035 [Acidimicrobiaceae bacterium]|nr:hypothetical protein [Acidimicrobiaceae bacterium]
MVFDMDAVTALYTSAAVLLVIAGATKVIRPANSAALIELLSAFPRRSAASTRLTRALGLAEITLGIAALLSDVAAFRVVVGVLYVVFAIAVWRAISVGAESCGCFGRVDAPPTWLHVFGNIVLAVCSFGAVAGRSPLEVMEDQPAAGLGFVAAVGVLAGLELVVFTALPDALEARKSARVTGS